MSSKTSSSSSPSAQESGQRQTLEQGMSKSSSPSAQESGQRQTSQGTWSKPTLEDYLKAEKTPTDSFFTALSHVIKTPDVRSSNTPPRSALALGMIILDAVLSRQLRLSEVLDLQAGADQKIVALLDNFNPRDRKQCTIATKVLGSNDLGGKAAVLVGKTKRSTVLKECDQFVTDNIEAFLTPELHEASTMCLLSTMRGDEPTPRPSLRSTGDSPQDWGQPYKFAILLQDHRRILQGCYRGE